MTVPIEVRESTPDHAMGVWKGVILYNWRARTTVEGLKAVEQLSGEAGKNGVGLLFGVVETGCARSSTSRSRPRGSRPTRPRTSSRRSPRCATHP